MAILTCLPKWIAFTIFILGLVAKNNEVYSMNGDVNGFVTMRDAKEWVGKDGDSDGPYAHTCSRNSFDMSREPRFESLPEDLVAPPEALSPIRIYTKETIPSEDQHTLHIYNNPGVYRGYSVSYGFQRNKECLHGADNDCVVSREFGKARAVVLNAERFKEGQNLNYLKDHFLIEETEPFVTIINGGTIFERNFYEAVFLGGYQDTPDATRSSHQIDGKSYPMEIYMYFVDESTPSMALTTIIVVLVEESDEENLYVKPIVATIEEELYYKDRQFLANNKLLLRKSKLYQNLKQSTSYDIFNLPKGDVNLDDIPVVQYSQGSSVDMENAMTSYLEAYENIQALYSKLAIANDDLENTETRTAILKGRVDDFIHNKEANYYVPSEPDPDINLHLPHSSRRIFAFMILPGLNLGGYTALGSKDARYPNLTAACLNQSQTYMSKVYAHISEDERSVPDVVEHVNDHFRKSYEMCIQMTKWGQLYYETHNFAFMKDIDNFKKYEYIKKFVKLREVDEKINEKLVKHFNHSWGYNHSENGADPLVPKDKYQQLYPFEGVKRLVEDFVKRTRFEEIEKELKIEVQKFYESELFLHKQSLKDITQYMKYGTKTRTMVYPREEIHAAQEFSRMPEDQKRRGPVEMGNQDESEPSIAANFRLNPVKAVVDAEFQISWLMPQNGGYFYYDGSSPLPPCFRAQNVLVFKKPIKMNKHQIRVLSRIPVSFNRNEDIRSTKPIIHDTRFFVPLKDESDDESKVRHAEINVPVYYEKRNHLFLGIDHVHVNAVEESDRLRSIREQMGVANDTKCFQGILFLGILASLMV